MKKSVILKAAALTLISTAMSVSTAYAGTGAKVYYNGVNTNLTAIVEKGTSYLPVRALVQDVLGGVVDYNPATGTVNAVVNGNTLTYNASQTYSIDGRTYLPVRSFSEGLGYEVNYDGSIQILSASGNSMSTTTKPTVTTPTTAPKVDTTTTSTTSTTATKPSTTTTTTTTSTATSSIDKELDRLGYTKSQKADIKALLAEFQAVRQMGAPYGYKEFTFATGDLNDATKKIADKANSVGHVDNVTTEYSKDTIRGTGYKNYQGATRSIDSKTPTIKAIFEDILGDIDSPAATKHVMNKDYNTISIAMSGEGDNAHFVVVFTK